MRILKLFLAAIALTQTSAMADRPTDRPEVIHVDLIELNHFHNTKGQEVYVQVIYWAKHPGQPKGDRLRIAGWHYADSHWDATILNLNRAPLRDSNNRPYTYIIRDDSPFVAFPPFPTDKEYPPPTYKAYRIVGTHFRESWTQIDPMAEYRRKHPGQPEMDLFARKPHSTVE